jgi:hypothetical protein
MSTPRSAAPGRQIGAIFVEKGLITEGQLALALEEQQRTGRLLGEICVARYGIERMRLADVLAEQWEGMSSEATTAPFSVEEALRMLLDEAQETRSELRRETGRLDTRLKILEDLVVNVGDALAEMRPPPPSRSRTRATAGSKTAAKPPRAGSTTRAAKPKPRPAAS